MADFLGIGGAFELVDHNPYALDLNLTTGGISIGGGFNIGNNLTIGLQRKLFSSERKLRPYALIYFTL